MSVPAGEVSSFERIFSNVRSAWAELATKKDEQRLRDQLVACIEGRGGEITARRRAIELGRNYLDLSEAGRRRFLQMLAEFDVDRDAVLQIAQRLREADDGERPSVRRELRDALEPSRVKLLRQFTSLSDGVKFLVDLRADLHDLANGDPILRDLEGDLRELLSSWFDVGFLELRRITWDAPAALLEKLAGYEAVHEMRGWQDLKARLGGFGPGNRRCFAFLHPLMPGEPLIFVEVALVREMAAAIGPLLDRATPAVKPEDAEAAIFYSISNCQRGLAGISFGNALIKRVVAELNAELPNLRIFATLSPIPGFMRWLDGHTAEGEAPLRAMLSRRGWNRDPAVVEALREPLMRLCAHYLLEERRNGDRVLDPVAHFHLSNGARVERLNWLGDISAKGLRESAGLMVNYLYKLDQIDANHEAYAAEGRVIASSSIRGLLR